ncbi:glycolate oxidase subunit GlcF [Pelomicrobium methylotrophicum]|uniref:Glycolate oxidase iron-sulfur subunit n=1 Tax=Pelomicrobium methylotrophicum TaxID=2602750 RepID=A0A5C7EGT1_9PROT|nr:glycolate oxidase subunit GlcF [Pelomicrobium methylotrophicum]TXF11467.1 glycolate oxidase subunit GlcF [Pelomicrobium methylotrophicum]
METHLAEFIRHTPQGREAESILRACVHCGFCTATCPTYQLLGDELDGPRGRIYLIKQVLEGAPATKKIQLHLDRCLTCRACETTCPSGVKYGRLADIGRAVVEKQVGRGRLDQIRRTALRTVLPRRWLFDPLLQLGQAVRPLLPPALRTSVPPRETSTPWPAPRHSRRMVVLDGCVQPAIAPNINAAAARVLDRLGISLVRPRRSGCCGAVTYHLNAQDEGLHYARSLIDAWWPHIEQGAEAVVVTATGCGAMVAEYGHLLRHDPAYAAKAAKVSALAKDISQVIVAERAHIAKLLDGRPRPKLAFHAPCTLQHALKLRGVVEDLLRGVGFALTPVPDSHLCCGSAGTYSILQRELSQKLLRNKVTALTSGKPELIATANIGCLTHLRSGTEVPVKHWIEVLDEAMATP